MLARGNSRLSRLGGSVEPRSTGIVRMLVASKCWLSFGMFDATHHQDASFPRIGSTRPTMPCRALRCRTRAPTFRKLIAARPGRPQFVEQYAVHIAKVLDTASEMFERNEQKRQSILGIQIDGQQTICDLHKGVVFRRCLVLRSPKRGPIDSFQQALAMFYRIDFVPHRVVAGFDRRVCWTAPSTRRASPSAGGRGRR
jgi:hypothetical protein